MWWRRRGNLRVRRYTTLFVGSTLCTLAICAPASDEQALRQALTIVQLLRAEYGRLAASLTEPPSAAWEPSGTSSSQPLPSRRYWTAWNVRTSPAGRRMDYDDGFGAHPKDTLKPDSPVPEDTQKTSLPQSSTSDLEILSDTSPNDKNTHTPVTPNASTQQSSTSPSPAISKTTQLTPKKMRLTISSIAKPVSSDSTSLQTTVSKLTSTQLSTHSKSASTTSKKPRRPKQPYTTTTTAPELQQAAKELANELNGVQGFQPHRATGAKPRATWHEHLARSTRYVVPLPDNHAFCYTDPDNALCRTFI